MKRMVEIEDRLEEIVAATVEEVKQELVNFLEANPDTEDLPTIENDLDRVHEIIDNNVPIWDSDIKDLFYLYGEQLEQAFDDAGIGSKDDEWPSGWMSAAIFCYIEAQVQEWYRESASEVFEGSA